MQPGSFSQLPFFIGNKSIFASFHDDLAAVVVLDPEEVEVQVCLLLWVLCASLGVSVVYEDLCPSPYHMNSATNSFSSALCLNCAKPGANLDA